MLVAIEKDRNMFIKAKIDPMFDSVRPQVDALLEEVLQKKKINAKKGISNAEFAVWGMKSWFDGDHASNDDVQKYNSIQDKISDMNGKMETQSYFGYDDALRIMSEANGIVDGIQANIWRIKNSSETELNRCTGELDDVSNKIGKLKRKNKLYAVITILILDFLFKNTTNVLISQGIIALLIILFILGLNIFLKDTLDWNDQYFAKMHIRRLNIANVIIVSYVVYMIVSMIKLGDLIWWKYLFHGILIALPCIISDMPNSEELSDLERNQTKLREQNNALDKRITAAKKSII